MKLHLLLSAGIVALLFPIVADSAIKGTAFLAGLMLIVLCLRHASAAARFVSVLSKGGSMGLCGGASSQTAPSSAERSGKGGCGESSVLACDEDGGCWCNDVCYMADGDWLHNPQAA